MYYPFMYSCDTANQGAMQHCFRDIMQSAAQQARDQHIPLKQLQASSTCLTARLVQEALPRDCELGTERLVNCRNRWRKPTSCSAKRLLIQKMKSLLVASIMA